MTGRDFGPTVNRFDYFPGKFLTKGQETSGQQFECCIYGMRYYITLDHQISKLIPSLVPVIMMKRNLNQYAISKPITASLSSHLPNRPLKLNNSATRDSVILDIQTLEISC